MPPTDYVPEERSPQERLVNLIVSLGWTSRPRTFAQLRQDTRAYVQSDEESARRMFERDKRALREMGVPVETVDLDGVPAYHIDRATWAVQEVRLGRDEVAALTMGIALAGGRRERLALSRLTTSAPDPGPVAVPSMRMAVVDDGLDPVADAVMDHQTVQFTYRRADGDVRTRTVDAWGLAMRNGAGYLIGWDHDRHARRTFRLSRVTSPVRVVEVEGGPADRPDDFDARTVLDEVHRDGTDVVVAVRPVAVPELEQRGGQLVPTGGEDADQADDLPDGWLRGIVADADVVRLRPWLLAAAPRVVVLGPDWLAEHVDATLVALSGPDDVGGTR